MGGGEEGRREEDGRGGEGRGAIGKEGGERGKKIREGGERVEGRGGAKGRRVEGGRGGERARESARAAEVSVRMSGMFQKVGISTCRLGGEGGRSGTGVKGVLAYYLGPSGECRAKPALPNSYAILGMRNRLCLLLGLVLITLFSKALRSWLDLGGESGGGGRVLWVEGEGGGGLEEARKPEVLERSEGNKNVRHAV